VLGFTSSVDVILVFYALMFLLVIPLVGLPPKVLAALAGGFAVLGPVLLVATARAGLSYADADNPTLITLVTDPVGLLRQLLLTGTYPVVVYLAFLCAGMAVGRLDLRSRRVAGWLLGGGIVLAVAARVVSFVLLHPLGGLDRLLAQQPGPPGDPTATTRLLWDPAQDTSWWYLALAAPHSHTPLDVAHVLGSAMAVLGASLLLTRIPAVRRLLWPVAAAGSMTLTLYSAHLLVLETGLLEDDALALYLLLVLAALAFAVLWRRRHERGPLERVVSAASSRARRAVLVSAPSAGDPSVPEEDAPAPVRPQPPVGCTPAGRPPA
jgi:uncharacterized membrane protein YeiB